MKANPHAPAAAAASAGLVELFERQHDESRRQPDAPLALRRDRLRRVAALWQTHERALAQAVGEDFGLRGERLTQVADGLVLASLLSNLRRNMGRWSRRQRVRTPLYLQPARAHVERQPLGVVGIIGPWNYPLQLTLGPAATALAAGNRVMLKPSEITERTSALLAELVARYFAPDEFTVVLGGADMAAEFAALPFDHLFFTGSTAVGRKVAAAAAGNLTPTTLELGGKSPCIVDRSCRDLGQAALKIAHGKLLNGGQTCIAPDYVLLPRGREAEFTAAYRSAVARLFPRIEGNADYAAIVSDRQHARLVGLLDEARAGGARIEDVGPPVAPAAGAARQLRPMLVYGAAAPMRLLQDEIFGPLLPVLPCDGPDDAIAHINAGPRPLALYWFGDDRAARDRVLNGTVSGGVTVNDTLMHIAHDGLPFGGVGASGWGAYHGETGFLRFTHQKAVFVQSRWAAGSLLYPPYGPRFDRVMALIRRLL
ncbi:coniferyl aldehyde dehydrogenase [Ottowia sp.]|uniref:coniferyl aldehyde dehydrogenase n=3 Tax=Ottowia sp. TaxID=1898956 RepID=UPI002CE0F4AF|nr:coniferyl aldehyde dehydrogenase [Ottowia sp.]HOB66771.1 coniferyl aldehyde dehydrogenase [Ottowia sp.]HQD48098.1 coniferyl aldehyde dehydrogenase [Ottowia sp.]